MSTEVIIEVLFALAVLAARVLQVIRSRRRRASPTEASRPLDMVQSVLREAMEVDDGSAAVDEDASARRAADLQSRVRGLRTRLARIAEGPDVTVAAVAAGPVGPRLSMLVQALSVSDPSLYRPDQQLAAVTELAGIEDFVTTLERWARTRRRPELRVRLDAAQAVLDELLAPWRQLARAEGVGIAADAQAVVVPAASADRLDLRHFPPELFPVAAPGLLETKSDWAALVGQFARALWRAVPGLAEETEALVGGGTHRLAPPPTGDGRWPIHAAFGPWLEDLFADFVAASALGPSAWAVLGDAGRPRPVSAPSMDTAPATLRVRGSGTGGYASGLPSPLRVALMLSMLRATGFDDELEPLADRWHAHGVKPAAIAVPVQGGASVAVPMDQWVRAGADIGDRLYLHPYEALAGRAFRSVFDFSLDERGYAEAMATTLRDAWPSGRADLVASLGQGDASLAAAPERPSAISGSRRPPVSIRGSKPSRRRAALEAVVLREVLERRGGHRRRL